MKRILLFALVLAATRTMAQDETIKKLKIETEKSVKKDEKDTANKVWKKGGLFSLNLAQGSLTNWAPGGDDFSLSLNTLLSVYAFYKKDKHSWDNTLDFAEGYLKTTSLGSRKNDDRIDILSKYGYSIAPKWNIAGLFNFRSQFFKGYDYSTTPKTITSDLLAPAYVLLSLGLDFKPKDNFSFFISPVTARWTIVKNDSLSAKGAYGVDRGQHSKAEFGAFVSVNYWKDFSKIVSYKGRLDLFSNYKHNPQNVDLYMTNLLSVKISKVLSASWSLDLVYDDDAKLFGPNKNSPALQVKSLVGLGILVKF